MNKLFLSILFLLVLHIIPNAIAQVHQYTNAAGRAVYSTSPPEGVETVKKKPAGGQSVDKNSDDDVQIYSECREKWGMDFDMKQRCINSNKRTRQNVQHYSKEIVAFCRNKWHDNWEMIEHCSRKQSSAK